MNISAIKKLREALAKNRYKCKEWCFECCTIVPISEKEIALMRKELYKNWFQEPPNGKGDGYCEFLTVDGKCSVYNQRPIICRSFSGTKYIMKRDGKSVPTQFCTYWDWHEEIASTEFTRYGMEIMDKWVIIGSRQIIKDFEFKKDTPMLNK